MMIVAMMVLLSGCSTVATQTKDGRTLKIKGSGSAKFENGAEIEGKTWLPDFNWIR